METTLKERLKNTIKKSRHDVFLRDDFAKLGGTYRQLSRALSELQREQVLMRAGYGLYMRPTVREVEKSIEQIQQRLGRRVRREVTIGGITVQLGMPSSTPNKQDLQDRRKLVMARLITEKFAVPVIRQRSLENMERWQKNGVWVSAFEEWRELLTRGTDQQVLAVLTGLDEKSNRLRQSAPYAGLLTQAEVEAI
ncbi:hypothetical protein [Duganella radicis]|uniref:Type IV toxin-antitoxin system AbiEi family antitoxin domain-containing protein n=1 Tax=Duganella radicis TaxID=551988 RepID=A0A6L6PQI4_9BURK|nr:hypothetical protein [Duganella radicis]MTV40425.1 hypothetical protein [Duganella radicis]